MCQFQFVPKLCVENRNCIRNVNVICTYFLHYSRFVMLVILYNLELPIIINTHKNYGMLCILPTKVLPTKINNYNVGSRALHGSGNFFKRPIISYIQ